MWDYEEHSEGSTQENCITLFVFLISVEGKERMDKPRLIGIISDTHDNLPLITRAVRKFNRYQVDLVLHAGDYVSPFTIPCFKTLEARFIGVYGNNCAERELLKYKFLLSVTCVSIATKGFV